MSPLNLERCRLVLWESEMSCKATTQQLCLYAAGDAICCKTTLMQKGSSTSYVSLAEMLLVQLHKR